MSTSRGVSGSEPSQPSQEYVLYENHVAPVMRVSLRVFRLAVNRVRGQPRRRCEDTDDLRECRSQIW